MNDCNKHGCRNLKWVCDDCGRVVSKATCPKLDGWISVKQLPAMTKFPQEYLVYLRQGQIRVGYFHGDRFYISCECCFEDNPITHYMDLPEPPK